MKNRCVAEPASALGTRAVGLVEGVHDVDPGQHELRARPMTRPRRPRGAAPRVSRARALLRGGAEELTGARCELLPNGRELELEGADCVLAPGVRQRAGELGQALVQPVELGALQEGDLPQAFDVGLGLDPDHATPGIA